MKNLNNNNNNDNKWCIRYGHQNIGTETEGFRHKTTSGDYTNYSIVEIEQNTKKSPGNLGRLSGKLPANVDVKNSQMIKMIMIIGALSRFTK